jgi:mobilome CxxCx(11)CxxC protein
MADLIPEIKLDLNKDRILKMCDDMADDAKIAIRVLQVRAINLGDWNDFLGLLGIIIPLLVGGIVLIWGKEGSYLDGIIKAAFAASIAQLALSGVAVTYKWVDKLAYYYEAMQDLNSIRGEFIKIKNAPNDNAGHLFHAFEINRVKYDIRAGQNLKYNISSKEIKAAQDHFTKIEEDKKRSNS